MDIAEYFDVKIGTEVTAPQFDEKRDCYSDLKKYMDTYELHYGKLCALYGLRRTGKTVMMKQCISEMPVEEKEKSAYILCLQGTTMLALRKVLEDLRKEGIENFFIDEITLVEDFQRFSNVLSDSYAERGRVVIAGTDSLGIRMAASDTLYDRAFMIHTTHIPYAEYSRLLKEKSLDEYMEYGGTLVNTSYKDNQKREEYLNMAIADNILHALEAGEDSKRCWHSLASIYNTQEIKSTINKLINRFSYNLTMRAIRKNYESAPMHATVNSILEINYLEMLDIVGVDESVKNSLGILNQDEVETEFQEEHLKELNSYLKDLDLFLYVPQYRSLNKGSRMPDMEIFLQPGMIYAHSSELVQKLADDKVWMEACGIKERKAFIDRADGFVKGEILENIILSETFLALQGERGSKEYYVSQLTIRQGEEGYQGRTAEADLIVVDLDNKESYLFEVKHSQEMVEEQTRHLINGDFITYVGEHFAPVKRRAVIYSGPSLRGYDVDYINAEEYLKEIDAMRVGKTADLEERLKNVLRKADVEK